MEVILYVDEQHIHTTRRTLTWKEARQEAKKELHKVLSLPHPDYETPLPCRGLLQEARRRAKEKGLGVLVGCNLAGSERWLDPDQA